jgi:hypothetical protein
MLTISPGVVEKHVASCCATVGIINPGRFAATMVIFVRSTAS